jgi:lysozyme family protein
MKENFEKSLQFVLQHEGGFVNSPRDPGGATNKGVTQAVYDKWRASHALPPQSVRNIDDAEVTAIYFNLYWNAVHADDLPSGVDYAAFDFCVNSGPHEADVTLQRAIHALQDASDVTIDGVIGPRTIAALSQADPRRIINEICSERLAFMQEHCDWADFGHGWEARVASVEITARGMA